MKGASAPERGEMRVDEGFAGIMRLIESGKMGSPCFLCGNKKQSELTIATLEDKGGKEHTEMVCYDCFDKFKAEPIPEPREV